MNKRGESQQPKMSSKGSEQGQKQRDPDVWRGMHRGSVKDKSFEASRRARPNQAKRRSKRQELESGRK